jgi:hypothetical protein
MRKPLALTVAVLLATAGLVFAAQPASAAPQAATSWTIFRGAEPDGVSLEIRAGEWGNANFTASVGSDWEGWAHPKKKKWVFTAQQAEIVGLDDNFPGYLAQYWYASSSVDPDCAFAGFGAKYTVKLNSCIDTVAVALYLSMEDEAAETSVISSTIDTIPFKANNVPITESTGRLFDASFSFSVTDSESLTLEDGDADYVEPDLEVCVNEDLVEVGDEALVSLSATLDSTPLPESSSGSDPWVDWGDADGSTFVVEHDEWSDNASLENVGGFFGGRIHLPESGTVTVTASAEMTIGGNSILEPCPTSGSGFHDPLDVSASNVTINATATTENLPDDFTWSEYTGQQQFAEDGFGGMFSYPMVDFDVITDITATHFDSTGPQNNLDDGVGHINPPSFGGDLRAGRWGAGGSQVLSVGLDDWDWWLENRPMATGTIDTISLEQRELDPGCGVPRAGASWVVPISAPTSSPLVFVHCSKKVKKNTYAEFTSIATVDFSGDGSLVFVANPTPNTPKQLTQSDVQLATNPRAEGSDIAVWMYAENSDPLAKRPTVSNRTVTTIAADGTDTQFVLTEDSFPGDNPSLISLTPGSEPGQWFGIGEWYNWDELTDDLVLERKVITVTDSSSISVGDDIAFADPEAEYFTQITALSTQTDGDVVLALSGGRSFDGETTYYYASSILDPDDGSVSLGEVVSNTSSDFFSAPSSPGTGFDGDGNMVVYWITSATEYQVVTWDAQ